MYAEMPKSIRDLQLELASKVDLAEISAHPNEDGNIELWMFYVLFRDGQELLFYITASEAKKPSVRNDFVVWLSSKETAQ